MNKIGLFFVFNILVHDYQVINSLSPVFIRNTENTYGWVPYHIHPTASCDKAPIHMYLSVLREKNRGSLIISLSLTKTNNRQTGWQTDKPTDRQTGRPTDRQTNKRTDRQTVRQTDRQTYRQTNKQTKIQWQYWHATTTAMKNRK